MSGDAHFVDGLILHMVGFEKVGEVGLSRRARLHTNFAAVELERGLNVTALGDEKRLTVVIGRPREHDAIVAFATHRPGRIARQHVDLFVLQDIEPVRVRDRHVLHLRGIVEDHRRQRAAEIDVEARPLTLVVLDREALEALVDAADERAPVLHGLEGGLGFSGAAEPHSRREREERYHLQHEQSRFRFRGFGSARVKAPRPA